MKRLWISQRVMTDPHTGERRDALDQRWMPLVQHCGLLPVLVPNHAGQLAGMLQQIPMDGLLLTGGNSLVRYQGDAAERDAVETALLQHALHHRVPTLGVCRGMQLIQDYFADRLHPVAGHVASHHTLTINPAARLAHWLDKLTRVNAYHDWGSSGPSQALCISARSADQVVMAVEHPDYPLYGQMWHSEREAPFIQHELDIIEHIFHSS